MNTNPYVKTDWFDEIVDPVTNDVIEEGTRFTAKRANNIEEGIYSAHDLLIEQENRLLRLQVMLELDGRAPGNSGSFSDTLDGTYNKLTKQTALADITEAITAGTTVLPVDNVVGFVPFTEVTVFDSTNHEDVLVTAVGADTITVQALANGYVKGAKVARSNVAVDTENKEMVVSEWGTFTVSVSEVV